MEPPSVALSQAVRRGDSSAEQVWHARTDGQGCAPDCQLFYDHGSVAIWSLQVYAHRIDFKVGSLVDGDPLKRTRVEDEVNRTMMWLDKNWQAPTVECEAERRRLRQAVGFIVGAAEPMN